MNHVCVCACVCAFELKERKKLIHKVKMQVGASKTILTFNQDVVGGCEKEPVSKMWHVSHNRPLRTWGLGRLLSPSADSRAALSPGRGGSHL